MQNKFVYILHLLITTVNLISEIAVAWLQLQSNGTDKTVVYSDSDI